MTVWEFKFQSSIKIGIHLSEDIQQSILLRWETIRGLIPDRIISLEKIINTKQAQLSNETNFELSCQLNHDIAELASIINELMALVSHRPNHFRKDASIMHNFSN